MRRVLKISTRALCLALVAWLSFVAWSIYSMLPNRNNALGDSANQTSAQVSHTTFAEASAPNAEPEPRAANGEPRTQSASGGAQQLLGDIVECNDPNAALRWRVADPTRWPAAPALDITSAEMLEEHAMAGNASAQWLIGFHLQQQVVMRTPKSDRSSISPQRFEYLQNMLILAAKKGSRSAAHALADAYVATEHDVVETAAWLRIAGDRLADYERQGLVVLSNEQRTESVRVAAELAQLYNLPLSRDAALSSEVGAPVRASDTCIAGGADPYAAAVADLETYRTDVKRNSFAPGIVPETELRRRFRDIRQRLVASLRLGNPSALPMLVLLHRETPGNGNAVAAAVWARVGGEPYDTGPSAGAPEAFMTDTTPALPSSAELPILSAEQIVDPQVREVVDDLRRRSVRAGILAEQYRMLFDVE